MANKLGKFVSDVGDEMKKVSWPNKEQLQEATIVTIFVVIIFTLFTFVIDRAYMFIVQEIIFGL